MQFASSWVRAAREQVQNLSTEQRARAEKGNGAQRRASWKRRQSQQQQQQQFYFLLLHAHSRRRAKPILCLFILLLSWNDHYTCVEKGTFIPIFPCPSGDWSQSYSLGFLYPITGVGRAPSCCSTPLLVRSRQRDTHVGESLISAPRGRSHRCKTVITYKKCSIGKRMGVLCIPIGTPAIGILRKGVPCDGNPMGNTLPPTDLLFCAFISIEIWQRALPFSRSPCVKPQELSNLLSPFFFFVVAVVFIRRLRWPASADAIWRKQTTLFNDLCCTWMDIYVHERVYCWSGRQRWRDGSGREWTFFKKKLYMHACRTSLSYIADLKLARQNVNGDPIQWC